MNSNRTVGELLRLFKVNNISELGSDIIIKYFDDISVKEVMKLCRVNRQFNEVCKKESMWRRKVKNDYGIEKKYGRTWKETARNLYDANMINLGQEWIEEKTYGELLKEGLESDDHRFFSDLVYEHKIGTVVFPEDVDDIKSADAYLSNTHGFYYISFLMYANGMSNSEADLQRHLRLMTREFSVIAHTVGEMKGVYSERGFALASSQADFTETEIQNTHEERVKMQIIVKLFMDPILYVMTYSIMNLKNLSSIDVFS
uniref:F-box-like protein n=1 Tax=Pithovirus LCPAC401 TaxID=2506595 RepID=A0A481ZAM3_9VIRU|nr:MAG: F-box-like protein [Pithovirus LCPAC401]